MASEMTVPRPKVEDPNTFVTKHEGLDIKPVIIHQDDDISNEETEVPNPTKAPYLLRNDSNSDFEVTIPLPKREDPYFQDIKQEALDLKPETLEQDLYISDDEPDLKCIKNDTDSTETPVVVRHFYNIGLDDRTVPLSKTEEPYFQNIKQDALDIKPGTLQHDLLISDDETEMECFRDEADPAEAPFLLRNDCNAGFERTVPLPNIEDPYFQDIKQEAIDIKPGTLQQDLEISDDESELSCLEDGANSIDAPSCNTAFEITIPMPKMEETNFRFIKQESLDIKPEAIVQDEDISDEETEVPNPTKAPYLLENDSNSDVEVTIPLPKIEEAELKCDICLKDVSDQTELTEHRYVHTKDKNFACCICHKTYVSKRGVKGHITKVHPRIGIDRKDPFECQNCQQQFTTLADLKKHKRAHIGELAHACDICDKKFHQKHLLLQHKHWHSGEKPFECQICLKPFALERQRKVHQLVHTNERAYECDTCSKRFKLKRALKVHQLVHIGAKPFECKCCNKRFARKKDVDRHRRIHIGQKPFECTECGKSFIHAKGLSQHKASHTGLKPFACDICQRRFKQKSDLVFHQRIHSNDRRYKCDVCQKRFYKLIALTEHERIHTGEKPFKCDACAKAFAAKSNLNAHKRTHFGELYECDICKKSFAGKRNVRVHINTVHTARAV